MLTSQKPPLTKKQKTIDEAHKVPQNILSKEMSLDGDNFAVDASLYNYHQISCYRRSVQSNVNTNGNRVCRSFRVTRKDNKVRDLTTDSIMYK
jgi:hypothetical protein